MLRVMERDAVAQVEELSFSSPASSSPPALQVDPIPHASSRYGVGRPVNIPAILLIVLVHAVLIFALVQARQHFVRQKEVQLSVVNLLSSPPPPPPAQEAPPAPAAKPQIVAPATLVQVPTQPAPMAITPVAVPTPPTPVPVSAAPPTVAPPSIVQANDLGTQMVSGSPPRYPIESRRKREQGTVVLTLTLGADGRVDSIAVSKSSGFSRLDRAALEAVGRWRWKPTIRDGQPVRVRGVVEIPFVIQERKAEG